MHGTLSSVGDRNAADVDEFACELEGWFPRLNVIQLPAINAQMLLGVVHWKKSSAGGIGG